MIMANLQCELGVVNFDVDSFLFEAALVTLPSTSCQAIARRRNRGHAIVRRV
jgi:hypothetical protein